MNKRIFTIFAVLLLAAVSFAGTIKGKVTSASDDAALVGANVYLAGTTNGAATDENGMYQIEVEDGTYTIVCDYVGYAQQKVKITVDGDVEQNFQLVEYLFSKTINVIADRAKDRETPVAFTNVAKSKLQNELGSRDIPLVLNTTPSVYSTQQGGGAGDARINVRGFNQRNVAIMINGVPVNDMENGWVYWSNWDGVGDATSSIQMQRGLSAVNLAVASIGGTMNILTDPTSLNAGVNFKQEFGSGSFLKSTLVANSGMIDDKFAVSALVVRKTGSGVIDKTWTDAWAYYIGASYNINDDNRLELYAVGAPQRHGQNLYKQNIGVYSHSYAKGLSDYDPAALDKFKEKGQLFNQNWSPVSSSYKGQQDVEGTNFDRHDPNFINSRENFYHKPQVNLNWYSNLNDNMALTSVLYYSGGQGGGSGTLGKIVRNNGDGEFNQKTSKFYYGSSPWTYNWDKTIAINRDSTSAYIDKHQYSKEAGQSLGILRNSRNNQYTIGLISKLNWRVNDNLKTTVGVDWRTAQIEHYREVRDLLGGSYYMDYSNEFDQTDAQRKKGLGDKIAYFNTNTVDWIGGFAQAEYTMDQWTTYATAGYSTIKYGFTNHFKKDANGNEFKLKSNNIGGYQVKGGAMYRLDENMEVYGNAGYVQKVPIFDAVIDDRHSTYADNPLNEKFTSFEAGFNMRAMDGQLSFKTSVYYTKWTDRALTKSVETSPNVFDILFLTGVNQLHRGFEFEAAYQPMDMFRLDLAGSIGNWTLTDDAKGSYRALDSNTGSLVNQTYSVAVKDLKIGDAPQTQFAIAGSVFPMKGMRAQVVYKYFANYYSDWDPTSRIVFNGGTPDRAQSWKVPNYGLLDLHASYALPFDMNGVNIKLFAHVFNLLDEVYIQDATDNSRYNAFSNTHKASDAEVFFGLPRTVNFGLSLTY